MGEKTESLLDVIQYDSHFVEKRRSKDRFDRKKQDKNKKYRKHQFDDDFDDCNFGNNYDEDGWS